MKHFVLSLLLLTPLSASAQTRTIWDSPAASVAQTVGITDLAINYHRPGVKGREIWGKLVPYGEVWRAGANEATTFTTSTPVKVAGKTLPAGKYALFVLPQKDKWTFVFSKDAEQWGAYGYKPTSDAFRFDVTPVATATSREWLAYELEPQGANGVVASLVWDKVKASFPIEVDVDAEYRAYLTAQLSKADASTDAKERQMTYLAAAKYWVTKGEQLDQASKWLDKAEQASASFWVDDVRARLLAKQGKVPQALTSLEKAKKGAVASHMPAGYIASLDALRAEWTAKQ